MNSDDKSRSSLRARRLQAPARGFSLMEVMIGMAIMGALAIALASLIRSGSSDQKQLQGQDDARTLTYAIAHVLSDPIACANTFGGLKPAADGNSTSVVKDQAGSPQFSANSDYGNHTLKLTSVILGGTGTDTKTNLPKWVPSSKPTQGIALAIVSWAPTGGRQSSIGPSQLQRYFLVDAVIDNTTKAIVSCTAETGLTTSTIMDSGTPKYLPLWITSNTLGDSVLFQDGNKLGLGNTSPLSSLDVTGGVSLGGYAGTLAAPVNGLILSGNMGVKTSAPDSALEVGGTLRLDADASSSIGLRASPGMPRSVTWTLPAADGKAGQALITGGDGQLSWMDCSKALSACSAQTIGNCALLDTPSGGSSGSCPSGDVGTCTYVCSNGGWSMKSNDCEKKCVAPGSATFSAAGTFVVPKYCNSLTVQVWGGGGGGGAGFYCSMGAGPGGESSFGPTVTATGGGPGACNSSSGGYGGSGSGNITASGSSGSSPANWIGGAGGAGGGPGGGAGGVAGGSWCNGNPSAGSAPGGGGAGGTYFCFAFGSGGGGGGYASSTFAKDALAPNTNVTVTVGVGGSADNSSGGSGAHGAPGLVIIKWQ